MPLDPLPPPLIPFQFLRLTAKILLRRLRRQKDLSLKIFGLPSGGTIGGPSEGGCPSQAPPPPSSLQIPPLPPPPLLIHPWGCPLGRVGRAGGGGGLPQ